MAKRAARPVGFELLGRDWKIKYNKDPDCEDYGETAGEQYTIMANPLKGHLKYNAWHEFGHALLHANGLNQLLAGYHPNLEEAIVRAWEYAMDDIIAFLADVQDVE